MKRNRYTTNRFNLFYGRGFWVVLAAFFVIGTAASLELLGITNLRQAHAQSPVSAAVLGINVPKDTPVKVTERPRDGLTVSIASITQQGDSIIIKAAASM